MSEMIGTAIFWMAKQILGDIINTLTQKVLTAFDEQIKKVINACVTTVLSGAWKGDGADRFCAEMTNIITPWVDKIITMLVGLVASSNLGIAEVDEADQTANAIANSLSDDFKKIYA